MGSISSSWTPVLIQERAKARSFATSWELLRSTRDVRADYTRAAHRYRAERGYPNGPAPYGYERSKPERHSIYIKGWLRRVSTKRFVITLVITFVVWAVVFALVTVPSTSVLGGS